MSKLSHPTGRLQVRTRPANSGPGSSVMTQGTLGGAFRKAVQSFFPLEAASTPLSPLLPGTPLSPPPSLLPSLLPTSILPFSSPCVFALLPPRPVRLLPRSLGVRSVNHCRRRPLPGPLLLLGSRSASGSGLGPPSALRGARRSVSGAGWVGGAARPAGARVTSD